MTKKITQIMLMTVMAALLLAPTGTAQNVARDYNDDDYASRGQERVRIDRYLDVELWTNHPDEEFYEGDDIVIKFRVNRDAFVAIYSVDTRGRVNMLFPSDPEIDNYVQGDVTYSIPGNADDFDLVVTGPEGVENIQAIASRERFPIPDWYPNSGLIFDWDDRFDYMDNLNERYFVRYDGQRFAYDRTALYINEWEDNYFRPVYDPYYPSWTVAGNMYIDYPLGGSVYINGIYWGIAPLYVPRLYVGWHTFSIYDHYGYCWESDVQIYRYRTVVLDRNIVKPRQGFSSKYKEVRHAGYRDPVTSGYPAYKKRIVGMSASASISTGKRSVKTTSGAVKKTRKYLRGEASVVKTERGWESSAPAKSRNIIRQKQRIESGSKSNNTKTIRKKSERSTVTNPKVSRRSVSTQSKSTTLKRSKSKVTKQKSVIRKQSTKQKSSSKKIQSKPKSTKSKSSKVEKQKQSKKSDSKKSAPAVKKQTSKKSQSKAPQQKKSNKKKRK